MPEETELRDDDVALVILLTYGDRTRRLKFNSEAVKLKLAELMPQFRTGANISPSQAIEVYWIRRDGEIRLEPEDWPKYNLIDYKMTGEVKLELRIPGQFTPKPPPDPDAEWKWGAAPRTSGAGFRIPPWLIAVVVILVSLLVLVFLAKLLGLLDPIPPARTQVVPVVAPVVPPPPPAITPAPPTPTTTPPPAVTPPPPAAPARLSVQVRNDSMVPAALGCPAGTQRPCSASHAFDGDPSTAWCLPRSRVAGTTLEVVMDSGLSFEVTKVTVTNGFTADDNYLFNHRPKTVNLGSDPFTLADTPDDQVFETSFKTQGILYVSLGAEVYEHQQTDDEEPADDVCLTEVVIVGRSL